MKIIYISFLVFIIVIIIIITTKHTSFYNKFPTIIASKRPFTLYIYSIIFSLILNCMSICISFIEWYIFSINTTLYIKVTNIICSTTTNCSWEYIELYKSHVMPLTILLITTFPSLLILLWYISIYKHIIFIIFIINIFSELFITTFIIIILSLSELFIDYSNILLCLESTIFELLNSLSILHYILIHYILIKSKYLLLLLLLLLLTILFFYFFEVF